MFVDPFYFFLSCYTLYVLNLLYLFNIVTRQVKMVRDVADRYNFV